MSQFFRFTRHKFVPNTANRTNEDGAIRIALNLLPQLRNAIVHRSITGTFPLWPRRENEFLARNHDSGPRHQKFKNLKLAQRELNNLTGAAEFHLLKVQRAVTKLRDLTCPCCQADLSRSGCANETIHPYLSFGQFSRLSRVSHILVKFLAGSRTAWEGAGSYVEESRLSIEGIRIDAACITANASSVRIERVGVLPHRRALWRITARSYGLGRPPRYFEGEEAGLMPFTACCSCSIAPADS
jgi:hypothetical protein